MLVKCLTDSGMGQAIVFTATKRHAEQLAGELFRTGISALALHGDLNQRERTKALNRLRRGECKVLVATDVAARGIDVSTITHVINYDLPRVAEDYVHRIGRTGRAGASGQALSLVGRDDIITLRKIEHFIGRKVQVSAFEGLEAEFKPVERRHRDGKPGGSFRKPFGAGLCQRRRQEALDQGPAFDRRDAARQAPKVRREGSGGYRGRDGGSRGGARAGKGGYVARWTCLLGRRRVDLQHLTESRGDLRLKGRGAIRGLSIVPHRAGYHRLDAARPCHCSQRRQFGRSGLRRPGERPAAQGFRPAAERFRSADRGRRLHRPRRRHRGPGAAAGAAPASTAAIIAWPTRHWQRTASTTAVARARSRYGADRVAVLVGTSTSGILTTETAVSRASADGALPDWFDYRHAHNYAALPAFVRERLG